MQIEYIEVYSNKTKTKQTNVKLFFQEVMVRAG